MEKATVRLVSHGEAHPYVIEVTTPGWRGVDHAFDGTVKESMPADLREIQAIPQGSKRQQLPPWRAQQKRHGVFSGWHNTVCFAKCGGRRTRSYGTSSWWLAVARNTARPGYSVKPEKAMSND